MVEREIDLISILEKALSQKEQEGLEEIGTVVKVADGVCKVYGLTNAIFGEFIQFEGGSAGIVLDLDEDYVSIVLLDSHASVVEQEIARRTGNVFCVPVGNKLVGRIVNPQGYPLDALGPIEYEDRLPVEQQVPGISQRKPVSSPLETGIIAIDSLIPIGRGQRELVIGNRGTGKTSIVLDTILHQKGKDVICIYVSIGHKQASTAKIISELEKNDALSYTMVVDADASQTALNQFLAPYAGCTIGEYLMRKGKDVLIVYDDLGSHAVAYRELSLLLRRPPGREAYPGDIFYIHSRLLERSGQLSDELGGGSLTALPIVQTQGDDISAYIPTNLISITDGQIFLDTELFNSGIRPAVNIGLSVSRVGGAAQTKAMKKMSGSLKLELAQYEELLSFSQFGSELDKTSQRAIDRGQRAIEVLKQDERHTYPTTDQVIFLFLLKEGLLDNLALSAIKPYSVQFVSYVQGAYNAMYENIRKNDQISEQDSQALKKVVDEFSFIFAPA